MRVLLILVLAQIALAADFTSTAAFSTITEKMDAAISYTIPSGDVGSACTWEVSESPSYSPLVHDVDTTLFAGASSDQRNGGNTGQSRVFVVGRGGLGDRMDYAPIDLTAGGYHRSSRALQVYTTHYARVTCGSDTATMMFVTSNINPGDTYTVVPYQLDPVHPGDRTTPSLDWASTTQVYVDPKLGTLHQMLNKAGYYVFTGGTGFYPFDYAYGTGASWSNVANALLDNGTPAIYSGTTNEPLTVTAAMAQDGSDFPVGMNVCVKGSKALNGTTVTIAMTENGGISPYGKTITLALPVVGSYSGQETCAGDSQSTPTPFLAAWLYPGQETGNLGATSGYADSSSNTVTLLHHGGASANFQTDFWVAGTPFIYNGTATTVSSFTTSNVMNVAAALGTNSNLAWTSPAWGFMIMGTGSISIYNVRVYKTLIPTETLSAGSGSTKNSTNTRYSDGAGHTGFLFSSYEQGHGFYNLNWINPDASPADSRFLGRLTDVEPYAIDDSTTPPSIYQLCKNGDSICSGFATSDQHLRRGVIDAAGYPDQAAYSSGSVAWTFTDLTPDPSPFGAKMTAFDPLALVPMAINCVQEPGTLLLYQRFGAQDSAGWLAAYDTVNNVVLGAVSVYGTPNMRWMGLHTALCFYGSTRYPMSDYPFRGGYAYGGAYKLTVADNAINNTTLSNCGTLLTSLGLVDHLGVASLVRCAIANFTSLTPVTGPSDTPPNDSTPGPIIIGDTMLAGPFPASGTLPIFASTEWLRVVGIGTCIASCPVVLERQLGSDHLIGAHASGTLMAMHHTVPTSLLDFAGIVSDSLAGPTWWDYRAAPHGDTGDPYQIQNPAVPSATMPEPNLYSASHSLGRGGFFLSDGSGVANAPSFSCPALATTPLSRMQPYTYRLGAWPNNFAGTIGCTAANPLFDGTLGSCSGENCDNHPNAGAQIGIAKDLTFFDNRPRNVLFDHVQTTAKVGTYIFKITNFAGDDDTDYKRVPVQVRSGYHYLLNISGTTLTDTVGDNWKFCRAYTAGDCYAGSAGGEVYANIPLGSVRPVDYNGTGGTYGCVNSVGYPPLFGMRDVCAWYVSSVGDYTVQYSLTQDPFGDGGRNLSSMALGGFTLADGSYTFGNMPRTRANAPGKLMMIKVPPYTGLSDGTLRTWIPIPVSSGTPPAGTATAYVEFGYNPSKYCSPRNEICVANANFIQTGNSVYSYETSDAPVGIICTSACSVEIPAVSQRLLWYQWKFFNSIGGSTGSGPVVIRDTTGVAVAPTITTTCPMPTATQGSAYSQTLMASGSIPLTWTISSGSLPPGLTLVSGVIQGVPTTSGITVSFTLRVDNSVGFATLPCSITVTATTAPTITTACPMPNGTVGSAYSQTLTATGSTPITWSIVGSLPAGLTQVGPLVSGTPSAAGSTSFSLQATNITGGATNGPKACMITVAGTATGLNIGTLLRGQTRTSGRTSR